MYNNNTNTWTTWDVTNSPLQYDSYGFGTDSAGKAFFGGYQQISVYNNCVWDSFNLPSVGANVTAVNDIALDSQSNMWLASDEGVWKYSGNGWTMWDENNPAIVANHVSSIETGSTGSDFVSSFSFLGNVTGGISIYNGAVWNSLTMENSGLPGEQIDDIDLDSRGNLWINTFTQGVTVYRSGEVAGLECIDRSLQSDPTGISSNISVVKDYSLSQNYPNPFNPSTNLEFGISKLGFVSMKVYNMLGKEVVTIVNESLSPGTYKYIFDGSNLSSGIYFYKLEYNGISDTRRMVLLKQF